MSQQLIKWGFALVLLTALAAVLSWLSGWATGPLAMAFISLIIVGLWCMGLGFFLTRRASGAASVLQRANPKDRDL